MYVVIFFTSLGIFAQDWKYDFDEAQTIARSEHQNIVLVFTGSDWCPPCKKLEKNILNTEEFQKFAADNYIWIRADFPKRKHNKLPEIQQKKNQELADRYNKRMVFPAVLMLNPEGKVLGTIGYRKKMSVKRYISSLQNIATF